MKSLLKNFKSIPKGKSKRNSAYSVSQFSSLRVIYPFSKFGVPYEIKMAFGLVDPSRQRTGRAKST